MTTAIARTDTLRTISQYLEKAAPRMNASLPRHLTADRLIRVAITAISKNPRLMECTQESLLLALMEAGQLGLEPNGVMGQAYLVPYFNKKIGGYEAQFQPGYRGLIDLARRSGEIQKIEAHVVREGETFSYSRGLTPDLTHVPSLDAAAPMTHVYAIAWFTNGVQPTFEVMTRAQVEAIRKRSKSANEGPWVTDYEPMARKTVVKQLSKWLPLSPEAEAVIEADNHRDIGEFVRITPVGIEVQDPPPAISRADEVRAHLTERAGTPERIPGEDDDRDDHEGVVWMEGEKGLTDEERAKGWGSTSGDELALDDQPKKKSRSAVEQGR